MTMQQNLKDTVISIFYNVLDSQESFFKQRNIPLSVSEVHTLVAIHQHENQTMSQLATARHVTVSTLSINISKLEHKGYVKRIRDKKDKRVVRVKLSNKAYKMVETYFEFYEHLTDSVSNILSENELTVLEKALTEIDQFIYQLREQNVEDIEDAE